MIANTCPASFPYLPQPFSSCLPDVQHKKEEA
jgi:hypothetical protein